MHLDNHILNLELEYRKINDMQRNKVGRILPIRKAISKSASLSINT